MEGMYVHVFILYCTDINFLERKQHWILIQIYFNYEIH